ncbi:MAG TPA: YsnF/AvaK domain-containing protein [Pyrinomonadaceae bacterium]|jgi:uncharacterized protein (TIGR02271 family)
MAAKRALPTNAQTAKNDSQTQSEKMVIPVIQEEITVGKQVVEAGRVRISKRISEHEELVDVPLFREEVRVERVPVNLFVEQLPPVRQEGDTMIIPVVEEQIVIQKKLLLVEELRVRKEVVEHHQPQTVNVRKEQVEIKRVAPNRKTRGSGTNR